MTSHNQITTMTPLEWGRVPDNPIQRDTKTRALRATHLMTDDKLYERLHATVAMARLPDGTTCKLDGHTRSYLWASGMKEPPRYLTVHIYDCEDLDEVRRLYEAFDSREALETVPDKVYGTLRDRELEFHSPLLKLHRFTSAMRLASTALDGSWDAQHRSVRDRVDDWEPELVLLDQCNPGRKRFPTAVVAGALLTLRRYGPDAKPFWIAYENDAGVKMDRKLDAVQALSERVIEAQAVKSRALGRDGGNGIIPIILNAFEGWRRDRYYAPGGLRGLSVESIQKWMSAARHTERTW